jgi:hypothetical protein
MDFNVLEHAIKKHLKQTRACYGQRMAKPFSLDQATEVIKVLHKIWGVHNQKYG